MVNVPYVMFTKLFIYKGYVNCTAYQDIILFSDGCIVHNIIITSCMYVYYIGWLVSMKRFSSVIVCGNIRHTYVAWSMPATNKKWHGHTCMIHFYYIILLSRA